VVTTTSEDFLSPEEVGDRLGVSVYTVRRWIKTGQLRAFRPGKEYRIQASDLEEFIRAREVRPKAPRRSPSEPSFNDVLAEEERRVALDYGACRAALEGFCAHWEPVLKGDRVLDRQGFDDFDAAARGYARVFQELMGAEKAERGAEHEGSAPVFYSQWSKLWPAIERFLNLGISMDKLGKERFGQDAGDETALGQLLEFRRKAG
jgi:excisionase family DNA binding protein